MADPAIDLATYIAAQVAGATLGTNVYHGPVRPPEDGYEVEAAFCIESGGPADSPDNGTANRTVYAHVQVRTRGDRDKYGTGKTWTDSIFDATQHGSVSGYVNARNLEARPIYIGTDKGGRHEWSWTVEMIFEE